MRRENGREKETSPTQKKKKKKKEERPAVETENAVRACAVLLRDWHAGAIQLTLLFFFFFYGRGGRIKIDIL